jgi:hypothetical protein
MERKTLRSKGFETEVLMRQLSLTCD